MDYEKVGQKFESAGDKMQNAGKKMQRIGTILILCITVPILSVIWLGPIGLVIGGISVLVGVGKASS